MKTKQTTVQNTAIVIFIGLLLAFVLHFPHFQITEKAQATTLVVR